LACKKSELDFTCLTCKGIRGNMAKIIAVCPSEKKGTKKKDITE